MLYFADAPAEIDFMAVDFAGAPADAEPQYWQRAAGFAFMLIAHAESRQRVKFVTEHAPNAKFGITNNENIKKPKRYFITLSWGIV